MATSFLCDKARVLSQIDLSRKGSVDAAIVPLLEYLNAQNCYYSTSSCAGRLVVFTEGAEHRKKGCHWLLVSHDPLDPAELEERLFHGRLEKEGYVYFKFEPFILHVMCATVSDAKLLLQTAVGCGFRNSGMSCGKRERWMVAVRSTHLLEVPLAYNSTIITSVEYRKHIVDIGNKKLSENLGRIERFKEQLVAVMESRKNPSSPPSRKHHRDDTPTVSCDRKTISCDLPTASHDKETILKPDVV